MNVVARVVFPLIEPLFLKSVAQGAATEVFAAVHPAAAAMSGEYLADVNVAKPRADANDAELAKKLWQASEEIVARIDAGAQNASKAA
jgi:WW domain-containing oxidoreductase